MSNIVNQRATLVQTPPIDGHGAEQFLAGRVQDSDRRLAVLDAGSDAEFVAFE